MPPTKPMNPVAREILTGLGNAFRTVGSHASQAMLSSVLEDGGELAEDLGKRFKKAAAHLRDRLRDTKPAE